MIFSWKILSIEVVRFLQSLLTTGVKFPIVVCTHSPAKNAGNIFIWRVSKGDEIKKVLSQNQYIIETSLSTVSSLSYTGNPKSHVLKVGRIAPSVNHLFYDTSTAFYLHGDATTANTIGEGEVNERVLQYLQMESDEHHRSS